MTCHRTVRSESFAGRLVKEAAEVISRSLSGMRFPQADQEDEGVRLVCDTEAGIVLQALLDAGIGLARYEVDDD